MQKKRFKEAIISSAENTEKLLSTLGHKIDPVQNVSGDKEKILEPSKIHMVKVKKKIFLCLC